MDTQLVTAAQSGDAQALNALFTAAMDRARKQAVSLLCPRFASGVDDVVQDAMVNVHLHLREFRGASAFATWLHVVVLNCARMYMRKHRRDYLVFDLDVLAAMPASRMDNADIALIRRVQREKIEAALETLTPRRRKVFVGHAAYGYTLEELGQLCGVSANNMKGSLFHARKKLRQRLAP